MTAYYNEHNKDAARWLRNLSAEGRIPSGIVDQRDIQDIQPKDIAWYDEVHLFAGIGGWPLSLTLAGWRELHGSIGPVWTGSCPCQPFSIAGKRNGKADARHLWPEMLRLIRECRPAIVFGEQVASPDGRKWLAGIRSDLEELGYAVGAADLCAAGVGAPHIRQRLFWVAHRDRLWEARNTSKNSFSNALGPRAPSANSDHVADPWGDFILVGSIDGKTRRLKPGIIPLAHGVPGRVGLIRGYGNAIVPQVAAVFVKAFMEVMQPND